MKNSIRTLNLATEVSPYKIQPCAQQTFYLFRVNYRNNAKKDVKYVQS